MKPYSYYVAAILMTDDMQLRTAARKAVAAAGLVNRKTFPMTARGKDQADAYVAKMNAALLPLGLTAICNEGFSMTAPV